MRLHSVLLAMGVWVGTQATQACVGQARVRPAAVPDATGSEKPERARLLDRLRSRDAVVIHAGPKGNPRFDAAFGTLLQLDPPASSVPGLLP